MDHERVSQRAFARRLRRQATPAERYLWQHLRRSAIGVKFRRQAPLLRFVADFYCASKGLVVEIDGAVHKERREYDARRDQELAEFGLVTLRFSNYRVLQDIDGVVAEIERTLLRLPEIRREHPRFGVLRDLLHQPGGRHLLQRRTNLTLREDD
jgi:very-short-patch-repair endonuclease